MDEPEEFQALTEMIMQLPETQRGVVFWLMEHYDAAEEICRQPTAPEVWARLWQQAVEDEVYHDDPFAAGKGHARRSLTALSR